MRILVLPGNRIGPQSTVACLAVPALGIRGQAAVAALG